MRGTPRYSVSSCDGMLMKKKKKKSTSTFFVILNLSVKTSLFIQLLLWKSISLSHTLSLSRSLSLTFSLSHLRFSAVSVELIFFKIINTFLVSFPSKDSALTNFFHMKVSQRVNQVVRPSSHLTTVVKKLEGLKTISPFLALISGHRERIHGSSL